MPSRTLKRRVERLEAALRHSPVCVFLAWVPPLPEGTLIPPVRRIALDESGPHNIRLLNIHLDEAA